jgi:hypothetical protein
VLLPLVDCGLATVLSPWSDVTCAGAPVIGLGASPGLTIVALVSTAFTSGDSGVIEGMSVLSASTVLSFGGSATDIVVGEGVGVAAGATGVLSAGVEDGAWLAMVESDVIWFVVPADEVGCLLPPIIIRNASNNPTMFLLLALYVHVFPSYSLCIKCTLFL